jgi:hypothetical protein
MNIEFHYYSLYYLCVSAGFSESDAETIALSSQLVDESISPREVFLNGRRLFTEVTQNYVFWDEDVGAQIYRPFHFIPGDPEEAATKRIDEKASPYVVTADSPLSRDILITALRTQNLFRIGIALHSYADTWAHQNYSGKSEKLNSLDPSSIIPSVGHLQALKRPDIPGGRWTDTRLKPEFAGVVNAERFAIAAKMVYRFLSTYNKRGFIDEDSVVGKLETIWKSSGVFRGSDSEGRAADYIIELDVPAFGKRSWLSRAMERIPESAWRGSLLESWNEAAKEHRLFCKKEFAIWGIS